jgi:hypothetical protein
MYPLPLLMRTQALIPHPHLTSAGQLAFKTARDHVGQHNNTKHKTTQQNTTHQKDNTAQKQHSTTQHKDNSTTQHTTTQHNTTQHNTTQLKDSTTQHSTTLPHSHLHAQHAFCAMQPTTDTARRPRPRGLEIAPECLLQGLIVGLWSPNEGLRKALVPHRSAPKRHQAANGRALNLEKPVFGVRHAPRHASISTTTGPIRRRSSVRSAGSATPTSCCPKRTWPGPPFSFAPCGH